MRKMIVNILLSILLGMIPETLFFTLFLTYTKNLKNKRIKLFLGISMIYVVCIMISRFKTIYYIFFIFLMFFLLKILYKEKTQIIDIFIINTGLAYISFISAICFLFVKDSCLMYYIMLFFNRIILFIPLLFKRKVRLLYIKYCSLWNRNDTVKRPIKSITLRNLSLIGLNTFIFLCYVVFLYILNL